MRINRVFEYEGCIFMQCRAGLSTWVNLCGTTAFIYCCLQNLFSCIHFAKDNFYVWLSFVFGLLLQLLKENIPMASGTFCGSWSEKRAWALYIRVSMPSCSELSLQTQWVNLVWFSFEWHCKRFRGAGRTLAYRFICFLVVAVKQTLLLVDIQHSQIWCGCQYGSTIYLTDYH